MLHNFLYLIFIALLYLADSYQDLNKITTQALQFQLTDSHTKHPFDTREREKEIQGVLGDKQKTGNFRKEHADAASSIEESQQQDERTKRCSSTTIPDKSLKNSSSSNSTELSKSNLSEISSTDSIEFDDLPDSIPWFLPVTSPVDLFETNSADFPKYSSMALLTTTSTALLTTTSTALLETSLSALPETTLKELPEPTTKELPEPTSKDLPKPTTKDSPETTLKDLPKPTTKDLPETSLTASPESIDNTEALVRQCTRSQAFIKLKTLSNSMSQYLDYTVKSLEKKIPPQHYLFYCYTTECSNADQKLLVAYKDLQSHTNEESYIHSVHRIVNHANQLISQYADSIENKTEIVQRLSDGECINNYTEEIANISNEGNLEYTQTIKELQRISVLIEFYSEVLLSSQASFYLEGKKKEGDSSDERGSIDPRKFCRRTSNNPTWPLPLMMTTYLDVLHVEIIELPQFANKNFIKGILNKIKDVNFVENDASYNLRREFGYEPESYYIDDPAMFNLSEAAYRIISRGIESNLRGNVTNTQKLFLNSALSKNYSLEQDQLPIMEPSDSAANELSVRFEQEGPGLDLTFLQNLEAVTVAVIDSGVDINHPKLISKIWSNKEEIPGNGIDDDNNGYIDDVNGWAFVSTKLGDISDDYNAGTAVAGIIAGEANKNVSIPRMCPMCKIMVLKNACYNKNADYHGSTSAKVQAINYALRQNVRVCNVKSQGPLTKIYQHAVSLAHLRDMIIVIDAGDDGINLDKETEYHDTVFKNSPNVISVASLDNTGKVSAFSNYGKESITLGALGSNLWTLATNGVSYANRSGSGIAAPHVTGAIALLRGLYPDRSSEEIIEMLIYLGITVPGLEAQ